jgi:hypothetical protein
MVKSVSNETRTQTIRWTHFKYKRRRSSSFGSETVMREGQNAGSNRFARILSQAPSSTVSAEATRQVLSTEPEVDRNRSEDVQIEKEQRDRQSDCDSLLTVSASLFGTFGGRHDCNGREARLTKELVREKEKDWLRWTSFTDRIVRALQKDASRFVKLWAPSNVT